MVWLRRYGNRFCIINRCLIHRKQHVFYSIPSVRHSEKIIIMLSGLSKCFANSGRVVARVSQRTLNTSVHHGSHPSPAGNMNAQFFMSHVAPKQSAPGDIDTILKGLLHHSVNRPGPEPRSTYGSCMTPSPLLPVHSVFDPSVFHVDAFSFMNRNSRRPKRANHGARPCSRSSRRFKKEKIGKRRRG